ncbi:MAG: hypothetical protein JRI25_29730 [Deltaproteobacteria bacterium]|nr:hypothetical protein [Deltaproteobacteria bacterium]
MRTTTGKPRLDVILLGERDLAKAMAEALAAVDVGDRATHGFHTYPAGLHPNAARDLLAFFPGGSLLDPFCGGGTILVEGRIAGRRTVGNDLNPTAIRVARTRTATPDDETLTRMRATARRLTEVARKAQELPPQHILEPVEKWYAPHVLCELEALRRGGGRGGGFGAAVPGGGTLHDPDQGELAEVGHLGQAGQTPASAGHHLGAVPQEDPGTGAADDRPSRPRPPGYP